MKAAAKKRTNVRPGYLAVRVMDLKRELRRADNIIRDLARLVRHYGYPSEMPNLHYRERRETINRN